MAVSKEEKVKEIISRLKKVWPNPKTALEYKTPLQLLVATILSAQATDKLVNLVTPSLFSKYKNAKDFANANLTELDKEISRVNFHTNKAKNIIAAAKIINDKYEGEVPQTMEELD